MVTASWGLNAAYRLHFVATSNPRAAGVSFSQHIYLEFLYVDRSVSLNVGLKVHEMWQF